MINVAGSLWSLSARQQAAVVATNAAGAADTVRTRCELPVVTFGMGVVVAMRGTPGNCLINKQR